MKTLLFLAAGGLALAGLGACAPRTPPTARVALDCPASQGDLDRTSISPDRKTCLYATRDGDQVSLRLIPVSNSYEQALEPIEQELKAEIAPDVTAKAKVAEADAKVATADAKAASADAKSAAQVARQAAEDALGEAKDAESEAKDADDVSANTHIDLPGIHISADEGGKADVNVGAIHVNAGENGATVRMSRDVRLRGEAFSPEKRGFRATYILARDNLKDGWSAVGYEAGGPKTGPVTVAVVRSRSGRRHDVFDDVKRLVRKNGGV